MAHWRVHWLEAEGSLADWKDAIAAEVARARDAAAKLLDPPKLDVLVQRAPGRVIAEVGVIGHAYSRCVFSILIDPGNDAFAQSLSDGTLARQVAHEAHHCMRMRGPGYGRTLGEALVSEGLAGRFVAAAFASAPEPWEQAVAEPDLANFFPDDAALSSTAYDHADWFFGKGARPRWLGYTLGFGIAGAWMAEVGTVPGESWTSVAAAEVIAAGKRAFRRPSGT